MRYSCAVHGSFAVNDSDCLNKEYTSATDYDIHVLYVHVVAI